MLKSARVFLEENYQVEKHLETSGSLGGFTQETFFIVRRNSFLLAQTLIWTFKDASFSFRRRFFLFQAQTETLCLLDFCSRKLELKKNNNKKITRMFLGPKLGRKIQNLK